MLKRSTDPFDHHHADAEPPGRRSKALDVLIEQVADRLAGPDVADEAGRRGGAELVVAVEGLAAISGVVAGFPDLPFLEALQGSPPFVYGMQTGLYGVRLAARGSLYMVTSSPLRFTRYRRVQQTLHLSTEEKFLAVCFVFSQA